MHFSCFHHKCNAFVSVASCHHRDVAVTQSYRYKCITFQEWTHIGTHGMAWCFMAFLQWHCQESMASTQMWQCPASCDGIWRQWPRPNVIPQLIQAKSTRLLWAVLVYFGQLTILQAPYISDAISKHIFGALCLHSNRTVEKKKVRGGGRNGKWPQARPEPRHPWKHSQSMGMMGNWMNMNSG